jgi:hypothetical protein
MVGAIRLAPDAQVGNVDLRLHAISDRTPSYYGGGRAVKRAQRIENEARKIL